MANINTTFFQLVAAFFIGFILAHVTTKYFERFERFPSPLVTPGPDPPAMVQGRDYIPHRFKPTPPPGPPIPLAQEVDARAYETAPPQVPSAMQEPSPGPKLPYPMTNDDYLSFITPEKTMAMSTAYPVPPSLHALQMQNAQAAQQQQRDVNG